MGNLKYVNSSNNIGDFGFAKQIENLDSQELNSAIGKNPKTQNPKSETKPPFTCPPSTINPFQVLLCTWLLSFCLWASTAARASCGRWGSSSTSCCSPTPPGTPSVVSRSSSRRSTLIVRRSDLEGGMGKWELEGI